MEIARSSPHDAAVLTQIIFAAKRHWGYPERWMQQWKEALTITPAFIAENTVYAANLGGQIIGFYGLRISRHFDAHRAHEPCNDPVTRPPGTLSPSDGERDGVRGVPSRFMGRNEGRRVVLEHLWVIPERIGTGVGRTLFMHAVESAAKMKAEVIELEADPNAEKFYERMGARRIGETISEIEGQRRIIPIMIFELSGT